MFNLVNRFSIKGFWLSFKKHLLSILAILFVTLCVSGGIFIVKGKNKTYSSKTSIANQFLITETALSVIKTQIKSEEVFKKTIDSFDKDYTSFEDLNSNITVTINNTNYGFDITYKSSNYTKTIDVLNKFTTIAIETVNTNSDLSQNGFFAKYLAHSASKTTNKTLIGGLLVTDLLVFTVTCLTFYLIDYHRMSFVSEDEYRRSGILVKEINIKLDK